MQYISVVYKIVVIITAINFPCFLFREKPAIKQIVIVSVERFMAKVGVAILFLAAIIIPAKANNEVAGI